MNMKNPEKKGDILVVDDHLENVNLLFSFLTKNNYEVRQVISGTQALQAVSYDPPDLILLDIMMPDLDGYQVCSSLKSIPDSKDIPIIFLTALTDYKDKIKGFQVGCADYITKPFQMEEVLARVKHQMTILNQKKQLIEQNKLLSKEIKIKEQIQQELKDINQKLERSNQDLEQFNSIIAHDLQNPLTVVKGYGQILQVKYQTVLNEQGVDCLNKIVNTVNYMSGLIDDLLKYAKVDGDDDSNWELVNCNQLLEEVLEILEREINKKKAIINYDSLPIIFANKFQMIQLFQNLIANAIKYCDKSNPIINISLEKCESEWLFKIKDNGIGIPIKSSEEIFKIFKRLDSKKKYEGTGIGLAICKKIVEFHKGKIWVESEEDLGSTFCLTFPLN